MRNFENKLCRLNRFICVNFALFLSVKQKLVQKFVCHSNECREENSE